MRTHNINKPAVDAVNTLHAQESAAIVQARNSASRQANEAFVNKDNIS